MVENKKAEVPKKLKDNKDIEDDEQLNEELKELEVESTKAGD
jgi:hypothetical protein